MKLLTTSEFGRFFGVSADAVRLWERLGKVKAIRTAGGQRLFTDREVERFKATRVPRKAYETL